MEEEFYVPTEIRLSEHRRAFRQGTMGASMLVDRAIGQHVRLILDESIGKAELEEVLDWYRDKAGAMTALPDRPRAKS